jgi:hypothetical protein
MICTCLQVSLPLMSSERLQRLEVCLSSRTACPKRDCLLEAIRQQKCSAQVSATSSLGKRKRDSSSWRTEVLTMVTNWFFSDNPAWLSDTGELSDLEWCGQIIEVVRQRLSGLVSAVVPVILSGFHHSSRLPNDSSSESRILIAKQIAQLPCVLSHDRNTPCSRTLITSGLSFIPAFMGIASRLLDGPEKEVTPEVHRNTYEILRQAARHHSQGFGGNRLETIVSLIKQGMQRRERTIRLSAG